MKRDWLFKIQRTKVQNCLRLVGNSESARPVKVVENGHDVKPRKRDGKVDGKLL